MNRVIAIIVVLAALTGCATPSATISCLGNTNVCSIERAGFVPETVYLRSCSYPGGSCDDPT